MLRCSLACQHPAADTEEKKQKRYAIRAAPPQVEAGDDAPGGVAPALPRPKRAPRPRRSGARGAASGSSSDPGSDSDDYVPAGAAGGGPRRRSGARRSSTAAAAALVAAAAAAADSDEAGEAGGGGPAGAAAAAAAGSDYEEEEEEEEEEDGEAAGDDEDEEDARPPSTFSTPLRRAYTQCAPRLALAYCPNAPAAGTHQTWSGARRAMAHARGAAAGGGRRRASSGSTGSCLTTAPSAPVPGACAGRPAAVRPSLTSPCPAITDQPLSGGEPLSGAPLSGHYTLPAWLAANFSGLVLVSAQAM